MTFQNEQKAIFQGTIEGLDEPVDATIECTYSVVGACTIECTIYTDSMPAFETNMSFRGMTTNGEEVWIPRLNIRRSRMHGKVYATHTWIAAPPRMHIGDLQELTNDEYDVHLTFFIPNTPLAVLNEYFITSFDGTIARDGEARKGICWTSSHGQFELINKYEYYKDHMGGRKSLIQVNEHCIHFSCKLNGQNVHSSVGFAETVAQDLEEVARLLSFLSRRRIDWFSMKGLFTTKNKDSHEFKTVQTKGNLQRTSNITAVDDEFALPLRRHILMDGLFQQLLDAYRNSALRDTIKQAIPYLIASREQGYFEARLGILYAALECIVDGLGSIERRAEIIGSSKFDKLAEKIRAVIRNEVSDVADQNSIIAKIPELRRRSYVEKLVSLMKDSHLNTNRFWVDVENLEEEIKAMVKRRNIYTHQGKLEDIAAYSLDFARIQIIVELWLLKILDCPEEMINQYAYSEKPKFKRIL